MPRDMEGALLRLRLAKDNIDLAKAAAEKCDFVRMSARLGEAHAWVAESKTLVAPGTHARLARATWGADIPAASVDWTKDLLRIFSKNCGCRFATTARRFL